VLEGQTAEGAVWQKLTTVLDAHYPTESGAALPIVKFAIDSGYATPEVYAWTRRRGDGRAVVIKGDSRAAAPVSQPSPIDVGPHGKRVRAGIRVWPVNGSMIKEELYRWLHLDRPTEESGSPYPPGYCHFPKYGEEYFKQITAEQLVTRIVKGYRRAEWQKTRDRNEAIDARTYARAAASVYALPFEGTHIVVFYDRVKNDRVKNRPGYASAVLGHVIAHEVTHILQGATWHSETGIMKAQWSGEDFQKMDWKPLQFTDEDIMRIQRGLKLWEASRASRGGVRVPVARQ
jgi:phage terminase large subunit GpA-like protein